MPLSIRFTPRRLASVSVLALGLALAGCAGDDEVTASGSPFSQALFKDYTDLATEAASAPAPEVQDTGFFSDLFSMFGGGPSNPADAVVDEFHDKADQAAKGNEPPPEAAPADATAQGLRARLVAAVARGKDRFPDQAARAQADYDCWVMDRGAANLSAQGAECRSALNNSLLALENTSRPVPAPLPAPVASAPINTAPITSAPIASAPVTSAAQRAAAPAPQPATPKTADPRDQWHVIAYTYNHEDQAQHKAAVVTQAHPDLRAEVFTPTGHAPYLVSLGGAMTRDEAFALAQRARNEGLPRDTYAQNYSGRSR